MANMKLPASSKRFSLRRGTWFASAALAAALGCMGPIFRPQSPDPALIDAANEIKEEGPGQSQLVGSVAHPYGLSVAKVENVGLVTGLAGTGEDPAPSPQRAAMMAELNRRDIENPNEVLASPNTALVLVRAMLRPGLQKGETFDVEVRTPGRSETTSLRGGWLLESTLSEVAALGGQIHKGHDAALAKGAVLVDPSASGGGDSARATQGRILSGGVCTKSRSLGLILDHDRRSIRTSQQIGKAVNERFHTYVDGHKMGVAVPKTDEFIEIALHPRYKENVGRYMKVVRSIALAESPSQRMDRVALLKKQLQDSVTAESAALRLEALGNAEAIEALQEGALAEDREVRFYSAEALAYLDATAAVAPLAKAAVEEPAYRINALAALGCMKDGAASEALYDMLKLKSAETRYGAFRSLTLIDAGDPRIRGENLGGKFQYHRLDVGGPPMIHVTASHHGEVVLFGMNHDFQLPMVLDAGQRITVNGLKGTQIIVSRFAPGEPTQQRTTTTSIDEVIRAVVDLGGDYPDVVQMLQQAMDAGALKCRFRVDALPEPGRELLQRDSDGDGDADEETLAMHAE